MDVTRELTIAGYVEIVNAQAGPVIEQVRRGSWERLLRKVCNAGTASSFREQRLILHHHSSLAECDEYLRNEGHGN